VASFWNAVTGALELVDDVAGVKDEKTNLTTKLYDSNAKKQRCLCSKVSRKMQKVIFSANLIWEQSLMMALLLCS
jgi:hypothetical protein